MPLTVRAGGKKFTFPDGTTDEQIAAAIQAELTAVTPAPVQEPVQQPQVGGMASGAFPEVPVLGEQLPPPVQQPAPTMGERAVGLGETALAMGTGATTGTVGYAVGLGRELTRQILSGNFGTKEAADLIEKAALTGMREGTIQPQTPTGQQYTQAVGEAVSQAPPVLGVGPMAAPAIVEGAMTATPAVRQAMTTAGQLPGRVIGERGTGQGMLGRLPATGEVIPAERSVGAAQAPMSTQRQTVAEGLPVPFEGETALTLGQRTRDPSQLKFEKETAKLEVGAPLVARVENQTARFLDNFDALIDINAPVAREVIDVGAAVDDALVTKAEVLRKQIQESYRRAEEAGEMSEPVATDSLAATLTELEPQKGLTPIISAVEAEALRLKALQRSPDGRLVGVQTPLNNTELLRKFVNQGTDWTNPNDGRVAKVINQSIDAATEGAGGELYKAARSQRSRYAREFENTGLTARLLGTKGKTSERKVAVDRIFDQIIVKSSMEEINKLRSTLLKAGPKGKQAWADVKAASIQYIQDRATSPSQRDSRGQPILSPDRLQKTVRELDQAGKLDGLFGKKSAQVLRDLADLATDIYTAPPGVVNYSNTSSAIFQYLDTLGTFGVTGGTIPIPAVTILRKGVEYVKDAEVKSRIEKALKDPRK